MKKLSLFKKITVMAICTILLSCQQGPSQDEVLQVTGKRYQGMYEFLLSQQYQGTKKAKKSGDKTLFACTVETNYIRTLGLAGYIRDCPEKQCHKDKEYIVVREYLIGKNSWGEWEIYDSRRIKEEQVGEYWRPRSKSFREFYADKIKVNQ
jgi:hypothetical protein